MQSGQRLQSKLDIQLIYNKGRNQLVMDQQRNHNMINILKRAEKYIEELENIPNKNGQVYSKYHRIFKLIRTKACNQLQMIHQDSYQMGVLLKKHFNQLIDELGAKARRYEEGEKRIKELGKMHQEREKDTQQNHERIKEQMLELMQIFKSYAKDVGQDLKRDSLVIDDIGKKQDNVLNELNKSNSSIKQITKNTKMGFFTLIGYTSIAVVLWLLTIMLIIIF